MGSEHSFVSFSRPSATTAGFFLDFIPCPHSATNRPATEDRKQPLSKSDSEVVDLLSASSIVAPVKYEPIARTTIGMVQIVDHLKRLAN
jgi:hypothetical protein